MAYELTPVEVLILAIVVLWIGQVITRRVGLLQRFSIPIAVTGGLLCSVVVALLDILCGLELGFDLSTRDTLLLVFFSTIGLSAKLRLLAEGGRMLAVLGAVTLLFLVAQNAVGIGLATLVGWHWGFGLIAGSVSLAGGHGTAITWGQIAAEGGLSQAMSLGMAFATSGLILGGIAGGPVASYLIRRHDLAPEATANTDGEETADASDDEQRYSVTSPQVIRTILLLALCVGVGAELNRLMGSRGIILPGFLTAMGVGILLTNFADARRKPADTEVVNLFNDVSLHLFLAMSLMSMQLTELAGVFGKLSVTLALQLALAVSFSVFVVFRLCGRNYDAAVIAAGYTGLGLGATPVGVANMDAVTSRFGPSPKAFLVIPLVGAFLLDILNAFVIQTYIQILR